MNIFFMRELAARVPATSPLVVNAINPGLCKSELVREMRRNFVVNLIMSFMMAILARTTEQGGSILLHAAVTTEPEKLLGSHSTPEKIEVLKKEGLHLLKKKTKTHKQTPTHSQHQKINKQNPKATKPEETKKPGQTCQV